MVPKKLLSFAMAAAVGLVLLSAATAEAGYYVRPYVQLDAGVIDGYVANGQTISTQGFTSDLQTTVNLGEGTVKSYLNVQGPNAFAQVAGTFGEQLVFSPNGVGTTATFSFDYHGVINSDAPIDNPNLPQIGYFVTLYVYEAGSGVTYATYGAAEFSEYAVISQSVFFSMNPTDALVNEVINGALSGSFTIEDTAYDIFTGLSIFTGTGQHPINIEMNFLNTGTFGIDLEDGVTFDSASGVLLTGRNIEATDVPEPSTWALMMASLGLLGVMARRRRLAMTA